MLQKILKPKKQEVDTPYLHIWLERIKTIIQARNLITIYDHRKEKNEEEFDTIIIKSLFKVEEDQLKSDRGIGQLKLALALNRIDLLESTIFSPESKTVGLLNKKDLLMFMPYTIENFRVEFLKEFIERGVSIRDFLTVPQLLYLYNHCVSLNEII